MIQRDFQTVEEWFFWLYANLGMAHAAIKEGHEKYERIDFIIRERLYSGLKKGTMHIASVYEDEKYKLNHVKCAYCGETECLTVDHLVSKYSGGADGGDNLVYACKSCNSSKNKRDLLEWYAGKEEFPPILVLRRYMKLAYSYFAANGFLSLPYTELKGCCNLFRLDLLPYKFPSPNDLRL